MAKHFRSAGDGKYKIVDDTGTVREIYCILSSSSISPCSGRGWTLVMRLNGDSEVSDINDTDIHSNSDNDVDDDEDDDDDNDNDNDGDNNV